jgi:hypothetical protein
VGGANDIITIGANDSTQTELTQVPYAFILDRLYIHGDPELRIEVPGLFDLQVNGFGGIDFNSAGLTADRVDEALQRMLATGVTLAPEVDGAVGLIEHLVASGVRVAIGHTAAAPGQIAEAIAAGATLATHLGNGCAQMLPRHPNVIWEPLAADAVFASLIVEWTSSSAGNGESDDACERRTPYDSHHRCGCRRRMRAGNLHDGRRHLSSRRTAASRCRERRIWRARP